jgi:hypothetical protein
MENTFQDPHVAEIFSRYPEAMRNKMLFLRRLVFEVAEELDETGEIEETTKWGEPSYLVSGGSTLRMDWKASNPKQYAMYFHCKTRLVDTFKELYGHLFRFEGNRAIIFHEDDKVPVNELKYCIALSLTYHRRKHLPLLGASPR